MSKFKFGDWVENRLKTKGQLEYPRGKGFWTVLIDHTTVSIHESELKPAKQPLKDFLRQHNLRCAGLNKDKHLFNPEWIASKKHPLCIFHVDNFEYMCAMDETKEDHRTGEGVFNIGHLQIEFPADTDIVINEDYKG